MMINLDKSLSNSTVQKNKKLRCLIVHNSYLIQGGEDIVVQSEIEMLKKNGHTVKLVEVDNHSLTSPLARVKTALNITHSSKSKKMLSHKILNFEPDIVHVHTFFPLLKPSIYDACIEANVPVIQTLHNFRLICPGALLMKNGIVCESCIKGSPYNSVLHGCYRNSKIQTIPVARMVSYHRKKKTWTNKVTQFIALSQFAKTKFIEAGFPEDKITVKPNFTETTHAVTASKQQTSSNEYALYVGRLSPEKGISTLVDAWKNINTTLKIIGHGPLSNLFDNPHKNIEYLGSLSKTEVLAAMRDAKFLVMPSECYESFPLVIIEAFSQGIPVVASRLGAMSEDIKDGYNSLIFEPGSSSEIQEKALWMLDNSSEIQRMGINAKQTYQSKYTLDSNYKLLLGIYKNAITSQRSTFSEYDL